MEELVRGAQRGDRRAFEALARQTARLVGSIALSRLGRPDEIDDVLQEVFTRAWANLDRLREPSKFSSWIYGIAKWVCSERLAERARAASGSSFEFERASGAEPDERREELLQAVEELPEIYRETLMMLYFEERSYAEIAAALGITRAAVNFRLTKARSLLRRRLAEVSHDVR